MNNNKNESVHNQYDYGGQKKCTYCYKSIEYFYFIIIERAAIFDACTQDSPAS
jgi:hypothetical protein